MFTLVCPQIYLKNVLLSCQWLSYVSLSLRKSSVSDSLHHRLIWRLMYGLTVMKTTWTSNRTPFLQQWLHVAWVPSLAVKPKCSVLAHDYRLTCEASNVVKAKLCVFIIHLHDTQVCMSTLFTNILAIHAILL